MKWIKIIKYTFIYGNNLKKESSVMKIVCRFKMSNTFLAANVCRRSNK